VIACEDPAQSDGHRKRKRDSAERRFDHGEIDSGTVAHASMRHSVRRRTADWGSSSMPIPAKGPRGGGPVVAGGL